MAPLPRVWLNPTMRLFQYWDTGDPPDDVAACIDTFGAMNPQMRRRLFSRDEAAWFINKHLGPRELKAFEACAVPAMQADYLRLCALVAKGGVWADADWTCTGDLADMLQPIRNGLLLVERNRVHSELIFAREAANGFFHAALFLATDNIEARRFDRVLWTAGPDVLNSLWAVIDPENSHPNVHLRLSGEFDELLPGARRTLEVCPDAAAAFWKLDRWHSLATAPWLEGRPLAYKDGDRHWLHWRGSIYTQTPGDREG